MAHRAKRFDKNDVNAIFSAMRFALGPLHDTLNNPLMNKRINPLTCL
jgi:hypothetical protein